MDGNMLARPGWVRLGFTYFMSEEEVAYILRAVGLIAELGWRLLGEYEGDLRSGTWGYGGYLNSHSDHARSLFSDLSKEPKPASHSCELQEAMEAAVGILTCGSPADCEMEGLKIARSGSGRLAGA